MTLLEFKNSLTFPQKLLVAMAAVVGICVPLSVIAITRQAVSHAIFIPTFALFVVIVLASWRSLLSSKRSQAIEIECERAKGAAMAAQMAAEGAAYASDDARKIFTNVVAHELRTPIQAVMASIDVIEMINVKNDAQNAEGITKATKRVRSAIKMMQLQLRDLSELSKSSDPTLSLREEAFSLRDLMQQIIDSAELSASAKHLELTTTVDPILGELIIGDKARLLQVMTNIVSNAIKYTECGHIHVQMRMHGPKLLIEVKDSGIGIPASDLKFIFTPFGRGRNAHNISGVGLGLSIAQKIVIMMGGTIEVSSQEGSGTTVEIIIPLNQVCKNRMKILAIAPASQNAIFKAMESKIKNPMLIAEGNANAAMLCKSGDIGLVIVCVSDADINSAGSAIATAAILRNEFGAMAPKIIAVTEKPDMLKPLEYNVFDGVICADSGLYVLIAEVAKFTPKCVMDMSICPCKYSQHKIVPNDRRLTLA